MGVTGLGTYSTLPTTNHLLERGYLAEVTDALTGHAPDVLHEELLQHDEPQLLAEDEVHLVGQRGKAAAQEAVLNLEGKKMVMVEDQKTKHPLRYGDPCVSLKF